LRAKLLLADDNWHHLLNNLRVEAVNRNICIFCFHSIKI